MGFIAIHGEPVNCIVPFVVLMMDPSVACFFCDTNGGSDGTRVASCKNPWPLWPFISYNWL